ncbi:MAG: NfeD family protein [Alphaproteobacteria bacterium]|nr:NfeD family protein [Alphaproteobacteria bacterium]
MDLIALVGEYGGWSWIIGGAALLALELAVPGGILVWFGAAAVLTGLVVLRFDLSWQLQWGLFAVVSIAAVVVWTRIIRKRPPPTDQPFLNKRTGRFIGQVHALEVAIEDGAGKLRIGDSTWRVTGPNLPVGTRVRVIGADAATLKVEPVEAKSGTDTPDTPDTPAEPGR